MCHSFSLFPFYTPLSLPSFLSFLRTRSLYFTFLRYANCLERVTSSTSCKWQGLIRFASQYLGRFLFFLIYFFSTLPACRLTRSCVEFYSISFFSLFSFFPLFIYLFILFFFGFSLSLLPYYTRSVASVRSAHLTGPSDHFSRPGRGTSPRLALRACAISSRLWFLSFGVLPKSVSSSEVRCASLRIVMPPHY